MRTSGTSKETQQGKHDIHARFKAWKDSEWVKNEFFDAMKRKENNGIYVEQMYGSDTTSYRNYVLKMWRELINSKAILTEYLKYPAKLFVKVGDITYRKCCYW